MTSAMFLFLSMMQNASAQDVSDAVIAERLLTPSAAAARPLAPSGSGSPWWIWPLGVLGIAGAAGMAYQNRRTEGISSDVIVLSRTAVTRTSSLAVIEVSDAGGQARRMLVGLGGGAPSLVADLSDNVAATAATAAALEDAWMSAGESEPAAVAAPVEAAVPAAEPEATSPRRRGAAAYAAAEEAPEQPARPRRRRRKPADKVELISAVLAERQDVARETPRRRRKGREEEAWQDPWARNFAAILGQPSAQSK